MLQYHYDPVTLAYLGSTAANIDPESEGNFLIAADALVVAPEDTLKPTAGQAIGVNPQRTDWMVYTNQIGVTYYNADGVAFVIQTLGETVPPWALPYSPAQRAQDLQGKIAVANNRIVSLVDATDPTLNDSVQQSDIDALKAWRKYRNELLALDLTTVELVWPGVPA